MRIVSMFMILLLMAPLAFAGKITGKVTDEKTGEPIIGAIIAVKNTEKGSVSDVDGNYFIDIADGTYVLEIKYVGYTTKEVDNVVVKGDEPTMASITIKEAGNSQTLEEVVVRSSLKKENISALYTMQKNAVAVSSGISADIIQKSPDKNTGEVLKRVSGASIQNNKFVVIRGLNDRYNLTMINGALMPSTEPDRKAFSFDVIPSNLIDNIIITKTASADLPGDFAGGIVQVLTKDVPDQNFLSVNLSLGYNTQVTFKQFHTTTMSTGNYFGFRNTNEDLPSSFGQSFSEYKSASPETRFNAAKQLNNDYKAKSVTALPNIAAQIAAGNSKTFNNGGKLGTVLGVSYRSGYNEVPDFARGNFEVGRINLSTMENSNRYNSTLALMGNFAYLIGKSKISFKNLYNTIHDQNFYDRRGYHAGSLQDLKVSSTVPFDRSLYNGQLDGEHSFGKNNNKINWNLNYSKLRAFQNDLRTAYYSRSITLDPVSQEPIYDESQPYMLIDRNSRRFFSDLTDNSYGGSAYTTIPFEMFKQKQSLKAGYLGQYRSRDFSARIFQYQPFSVLDFDHSISTQPVDRIFDAANIGPKGYELLEITNPTDAYKASSLLNAGYLMLDNYFSEKWRATWGVRVESYTQNLKSIDLSAQQVDKTTTFMDVLPSVNLSYSVNDDNKIRLSASRTVNRPEFRELASFTFFDIENNWNVIGNQNLVRANITNVDLRYEYYPQPGETITIGAFYKHFTNPIEQKMDDQSNLDALYFTYQNVPNAQAYGAELEIRKNLQFLSENTAWLENLTFGTNLTYVNSKVSVSQFGIAQNRPLQGQSPYLVNVSLSYADPKTGLTLSALYNKIGSRIFIVGSRDIPTTWEYGRHIVDLQIGKPVLKKRGEIKLTVADLLNQRSVFYWDNNDNTSYQKSIDHTFQGFRWGTTFTLGFSYKF